MKLIDGAERIDELNEKRVRAFDRRTEIGRDLTKAKGELARLPEVAIGTPLDVAALVAERSKLAEVQRAGDAVGADYRAGGAATTRRARATSQKEITDARRRARATQRGASLAGELRRDGGRAAGRELVRLAKQGSRGRGRGSGPSSSRGASSSTPTSRARTSTTAPSSRPRRR
jgi:hypothetical protein